MSDSVVIRPARPSDVPAIAHIYGHHCLHGTGTFDTEPPPESRWRDHLIELDAARYPFLVSAKGEDLVGFAYAAPFRPRFGWRFSFEDTIYMAPDHVSRGYGTTLLNSLVRASQAVGARNLIAVIGDSQNIPSLRVHERCGFTRIGALRDVGFKDERWLDVVIMQLRLTP
jgi:L-amino acid N-acyltransferase YncA